MIFSFYEGNEHESKTEAAWRVVNLYEKKNKKIEYIVINDKKASRIFIIYSREVP